ncbi:MAG: biopolymer transporter ExbD [Gammaproteobacteria bacterium]|nr:biopolymer transporter ExbD [Gammaproteobacteria bacterium]
MKLVRRDPRPPRDDHLIPLINVIFLMLIFFMITGQIRSQEPVRVNPPVSEQEASRETSERVILLDAEGRMAVGDRLVSRERLHERLVAWQAEAAASGSSAGITLKADAALTASRLRETFALLETAGIEQVELITRTAGSP